MRTNTQATAIKGAFVDIHRGLTAGFAGYLVDRKPNALLTQKPKRLGWPVMAVRCLSNVETDADGNRMVDAQLTPGGIYQAAVMRLSGGALRLWVRNDAGNLSLCRFDEFTPLNPARRSRFGWGQ